MIVYIKNNERKQNTFVIAYYLTCGEENVTQAIK